MERQDAGPPMCAAGCGFFGNRNSENMCSKCFRDLQSRRKAGLAPASTSSASATPSITVAAPSVSAAAAAAPAPMSASASLASVLSSKAMLPTPSAPIAIPGRAAAAVAAAASCPSFSVSPASVGSPLSDSPSKGKHRCATCNKSVGLLGFKCRCENEYCAKHRHAAEHNCTFDYKSYDRDRLEKANPAVIPDKVQQI